MFFIIYTYSADDKKFFDGFHKCLRPDMRYDDHDEEEFSVSHE